MNTWSQALELNDMASAYREAHKGRDSTKTEPAQRLSQHLACDSIILHRSHERAMIQTLYRSHEHDMILHLPDRDSLDLELQVLRPFWPFSILSLSVCLSVSLSSLQHPLSARMHAIDVDLVPGWVCAHLKRQMSACPRSRFFGAGGEISG